MAVSELPQLALAFTLPILSHMEEPTNPTFVKRRSSGFSLVELLVVIAIIALLIALVLVSVANFQSSARLVQCMSNQHQLQVGLVSFSQDNNGKFMSPASQFSPPGIPNPNRDLFWVKSYNNNLETGPRLADLDGDGSDEETESAIRDGALFDYIESIDAYSSPLDPSGRIRSYSLNGFISDIPDNPNDAWGPTADRISRIRNPSNTMYTIAEHDTGWTNDYNRGGWVIDVYSRIWKDFPAFWEPRDRFAMSFIDGSSRIVDFANPKLDESISGHEVPVNDGSKIDFDKFAEWLRPDK
jgi:prepilin-type N-terminal cleavage/methylation domain-containing protein